MKVRSDFVSNSSSSSFIVTCKKQHLDDVAKDLANACVCKDDQYHDPNLAKLNQLNLEFCLKTFRLAFLGNLVLETKKETYSLDTFKKSFGDNDNAVKAWNRYKEDLNDLKNCKNTDENDSDWLRNSYGLDEYDASTDTAVHYEKVKASGIVVSRSIMEYRFIRYDFARKDCDEDRECRVKNIINIAKASLQSHYNAQLIDPIDIYQVTQDTIDNTRDLIRCGWTVELDRWEDLDELEAMLANGDAIFYVRIANSGDGHGDFYIYSEGGADGLSGISGIEVLHSECM